RRQGARGGAGGARPPAGRLPRLPFGDDGPHPPRLRRRGPQAGAPAPFDPLPLEPHRPLDPARRGDRPRLLGAPPARHGPLRGGDGRAAGGPRPRLPGGRPRPHAGQRRPPGARREGSPPPPARRARTPPRRSSPSPPGPS